MEGEARGENGVIMAVEQSDEPSRQRHASLLCEVCRMAGATQQTLHLACPVFFLDLDQRLKFAQMMGVA